MAIPKSNAETKQRETNCYPRIFPAVWEVAEEDPKTQEVNEVEINLTIEIESANEQQEFSAVNT